VLLYAFPEEVAIGVAVNEDGWHAADSQ